MLSDKKVVCPHNLLEKASGKKGIKAAIVNAGKPLPMLATLDAVKEKLIEPIFIGDKIEIQKYANELKWDISRYEIIDEPIENNTAEIAAKLASEDKVRVIVKGHIHTDILMKEVLEMLQRFSEDLSYLQRAIRWKEGDKLHDLFSRTRAIRRSIIDAGQD